MKFKSESLGSRVLLKPYVEKVSKGGIALVSGIRQQATNTDRGEVIMIGPSAWYDLPKKPDIKPGDMVVYAHWGAKVIPNDAQPDQEADDAFFIICNDIDILVGFTPDE